MQKLGNILLVSQVYVPDPAAVGQHMADAAAAMVERGWRVSVLTSGRGYDNPDERYPAREKVNGATVRRLPFSSFGKRNLPVRLVGQSVFLFQAMVRGILTGRLDAVVVTTSPPLGSIAGCLISAIRQVPVIYWVMDLNPDQVIAMGIVRKGAPSVRFFDALNRWILRRSARVIALDKFMAQRLIVKVPASESKISVIPPWAPEKGGSPLLNEENLFRRQNGMEGKRVVMYSGNHSSVHPLTTLLRASEHFINDDKLFFAFIGGGRGKAEVEAFAKRTGARNFLILPFQPLEGLRASLSAADVHVVAMGDNMVGCVHPCKVYGALALERPILALGPDESHLSELLATGDIGWQVPHGDVERAVAVLTQIRDMPDDELTRKGKAAGQLSARYFSRERSLNQWCDIVEEALGRPQRKVSLLDERA